MMATSPSLKREVNDLVLEQIHASSSPLTSLIRSCSSITSGTCKS